MPMGVAGGAVGGWGNRLVHAGGTNWTDGVKRWLREVNYYDVAANRWEAGPALPVPLAYGVSLRDDKSLEVCGGTDGERVYRDCWRLEAGKDSWTASGKLASDALLGRAERVGGRAYLFGGCSDVADLTRCMDRVEMREGDGSWRKVSTLPQGKISMPASAVARGKVYLFGGCSMASPGKLVNRDDAWAFDPKTAKWQRLKPLPHANRGMTATAVGDRYIVLLGGYTASMEEAAGKDAGYGFTPDVLIYDVESGTYAKSAPLPVAAAGIETLTNGNTIFAFGGEHRMRGRSARFLAAAIGH